jgi:GNAT superfamily N-acetyltransferase
MPDFQVRPFRRADREQVTALVNAHAAAVIPGVSASVNEVLSQFEREPHEFIVDPWVEERRALVAEQNGSIVAAALIHRHRADPAVGPGYRNVGDIRWLLFRPMAPTGNPYWHDGHEAAQGVMDACFELCRAWRVSRICADGALPQPGVYGVPDQWPHVEKLYRENGFVVAPERVEIVSLLDVDRVPELGEPPVSGLAVRRLVGINGTRLAGYRGEECLGYIEVEVLDGGERHRRGGGLADVGNLHVTDEYRRRGIASWLLRHAAQWLRLGRVDRLLHYSTPDESGVAEFLAHNGFVEIARTRRGWERSTVS